MDVEEILVKKKHGDLKTAGEAIGISEFNAYNALKRRGSKHHDKIKEVLTKIITLREQLIN